MPKRSCWTTSNAPGQSSTTERERRTPEIGVQTPPLSSGRPVLGEWRELELVCRGAPVLIGQEEDGIGDPVRVSERFRRDTAPCGPVERLDARVDDQQRYL